MSLEPAVLHREQLTVAWAKVSLDPQFRYLMTLGGWSQLAPVLHDKTWDHLQLVSIRAGEVIGWLSAAIDRPPLCVEELSLANFTGRPNVTFARDSLRFMRALFIDHGMYSVRWSVVVGNPAEETYDTLIERIGGRVIGCERGAVVLQDQSRHDRKRYEILASEVHWQ